mgnify:CR=1 FL=1
MVVEKAVRGWCRRFVVELEDFWDSLRALVRARISFCIWRIFASFSIMRVLVLVEDAKETSAELLYSWCYLGISLVLCLLVLGIKRAGYILLSALRGGFP